MKQSSISDHQAVHEKPQKPSKRRSRVTILIVFLAVVFLAAGGVLVWKLILPPYIADRDAREIQAAFTEAGGLTDTRRVEAVRKLQEINPDICGWLRIENTNINAPVMMPPEEDYPEYYLYRSYKKETSKYGSIFVDGYTTVRGSPLLYGHNMQDGRMFGPLAGFDSVETVKKSPVIQFDTYEEAGDWKIISVFKTDTDPRKGELFSYEHVPMGAYRTLEERDRIKMQFYYEIMKRSMVNTGVDLNERDRVLLLYTRSDEYEDFCTVVAARKVRKGEDASVDTSKITENENALFPDVWYASGKAPDYWPTYFEDALNAGKIDWYSGDMYEDAR